MHRGLRAIANNNFRDIEDCKAVANRTLEETQEITNDLTRQKEQDQ